MRKLNRALVCEAQAIKAQLGKAPALSERFDLGMELIVVYERIVGDQSSDQFVNQEDT